MEPQIVYQCPDFLILNKPTGLLTHPQNLRDNSFSVAGWLVEKFPQAAKVGDDPALRPGIVHRLDKDTSGLMIVTLTQESFAYFKKQFQEHKIKKTYLALVYGKLKNERGVIDAPLGKIGAKQTTRIHGTRDLKERAAVTEYEVLKEFPPAPPLASGYTLLAVSPRTGRTHQIRVHLKSIGHPIVGDVLYGAQRGRADAAALGGLPSQNGRMFLHAQKLAFTAPDGQALSFEVDPPPEFEEFSGV